MSPMCRLWSPIQELNIAKSEKYKLKLAEDRQYNHDTILTMCSIAFQEQFRGGREATLEHPWLSRAWNTRAFACLEEISHDTYVDQCMYGLQVPDHAGVPGLARKPTCFRTTKASLSEGLTCQCDGSHIHVPIEGNAPGGRSRSSIAEDYPEKLAKKLAYLMQKDPTDDQIFAAEEDEDVEMPEAEPEIESKKYIEVLEHDKQHVLPKELFDDGAGNIDPVTSNALLRRQVGKAAMNYVVRLHRNLGHPGSNVLCKMLEEVQATQNVMNAAKDYVCPECFVRQGPAGVPPAAGLTARVFGERLMADTAWIDTDDGRVCVMTLMDQATRYVAIRIMKSERSVDLVKGIERSWIKHFSIPKYIRVDEGKGFAAKYLRDWCSERNVILEIAPAESHNWISSIERKHQVVRKSLEIYMQERGKRDKKTLEEAAIYCPGQINSLSYTRGFTPAQWVLGRSAADTYSLTAGVFNPSLSPMNDPLDFNQIQAKRLAAQMAFLKADSDARLRRAMLQNFKKTRHYIVVGQLCYYWRIQRSGILQKNKWRGPARCVAEERDEDGKQIVLWLCHGTSLLRCSPHQVRPLVKDAGLHKPVDTKAALEDLKELRARSTTQFRDVLQQPEEYELEDLMDNEQDDLLEYEPSEAPTDREDEPVIIPDDEVPGAVLMYQRGRSEEGRPMSSASPSTEVPECPSVTGEDQEMKNEVEEHVTESAMKRARHSSAAEIPVPDDDDLFIEDAFIVEMEPGTLPKGCCLIDGEFELDEAFLAEVSEKHMTLEEKEKMIQAKQKELMQYFDNKVWEFTELGKHQTNRVITARWVLVWKPPSDGELQRKAKARLVLRGFQDPDYLSLEKNSPTASKTSKMILLSLTPVLEWTIFCGDVRAAFLSGATFDREIIVKLPSDCSAMLGNKGPTYMKMKKSAYGLCDAPLLWWTEADRRLRELEKTSFVQVYIHVL